VQAKFSFFFSARHHHSLVAALKITPPSVRTKNKVFCDRIDTGTCDCHSLAPQTLINQHPATRTRNRRASASQEPLAPSQQTTSSFVHTPFTMFSSECVRPCFRCDPSFAWPWQTVITPDHSDPPPTHPHSTSETTRSFTGSSRCRNQHA
jgi:hypothetical protein